MPYTTPAFRAAIFFMLSLLFGLCLALHPARAGMLGEQRTAVILVNFQGNASQPITPAEAHSLVFGGVSDFYWEASYGMTLMTGDTLGWFNVPVSADYCDTNAIAQFGDQAAAASGAKLATYTQFIYIYPYNTGCGWSGKASRGPNGEARVFVNGAYTTKLIAHELGHAYGLDHADALDCGATTLGAACTRRGYGDTADTMGNRGAHFNAFHKERMGWLNAAGAPPITTVTASGRYALETYAFRGQGAKALKVRKGTDPVTGSPVWYYLEYRQPVGVDALLAGVGNLTQGLLVRTGSEWNGNGDSLLLDMTPDSDTSSVSADISDGALAVGRTFVDTTAGVSLTLVAADAGGAIVDVTVSTRPTCSRTAPAVTLEGPVGTVAAGTTQAYSVTVRNQDSACAMTSFLLGYDLPAGWSGRLGATALDLAPGASTNTTLTVTSPATAASGTYFVGLGVSSGIGSIHTTSAAATLQVAAAAPLSGSVATTKTEYVRGETVGISARLLANGQPVAGATVRFSLVTPGGGEVLLGATSGSDGVARTSYRIGKAKAALGTYRIAAVASSNGREASATTTFGVR